MRLTFLGTGTSVGVPVIGCDCAVCTSNDPRDRRTRHGAVLGLDGENLLIDTPPELRLQLLATGISQIGAIWYTHLHADHIHGIDDVRVFTDRHRQRALRAFVPAGMAPEMVRRFPYIFDEELRRARPGNRPRLELISYHEGVPQTVLGETVTPFRVPHGPVSAFGLRVGALGYVTDASALPSVARRILAGVEILVLDALWWGKPHPSHFNIEEAIAVAREIGPRRTFLTHLTHRVRHSELVEALPPGIEPAYDGLTVEIP